MTEPRESIDRRPIASRDRAWSQAAAHRLANRGISPNAISTAGMLFGILAGCSLAATTLDDFRIAGFVLAAVCIQLRLLCNMFDGMVAIETDTASALGELFNEVPDRVSDAATLIGAGYALGGSPVLGFIAACLALFTAYVRAQGRVAGAPQEYCGPMAKQQRMFVITLAALYAGLAPAGWQFHLGRWPDYGTMSLALTIVILGAAATSIRRLQRISVALKNEQP